MADETLVATCPLCAGLGEVSPGVLTDLLSNPEFRKRFDDRIAEIADVCNSVGATRKGQLDFQKEVHTWNPTLPIWRRSSKE